MTAPSPATQQDPVLRSRYRDEPEIKGLRKSKFFSLKYLPKTHWVSKDGVRIRQTWTQLTGKSREAMPYMHSSKSETIWKYLGSRETRTGTLKAIISAGAALWSRDLLMIPDRMRGLFVPSISYNQGIQAVFIMILQTEISVSFMVLNRRESRLWS